MAVRMKPLKVQSDASKTGMDEARRRRFWAKAKQEELKLSSLEGGLISRDIVKRGIIRNYQRVKDQLLNMPARYAAIFAAESDQRKIHDLWTKELHKTLKEISDVRRFY